MPKLDVHFKQLKTCVLLPTYNNELTLKQVIDGILEYTTQLIIVNDGSTDSTSEILKQYPEIYLVQYPKNQGKGMALRLGFEKAVELGYEHAISIDSDGQHKPKDLNIFLDAIEKDPKTLYVGARNMGSENVPGTSSFGHKFSNFWYKFNTGIDLPDTQSGYRSYPVQLLKNIKWKTTRFEFEIEVLVRADWNGINVSYVPIDVYYPPAEERVSHFRKGPDFTRISVLNTGFVIAAIFYIWPKKFVAHIRENGPKKFFNTYIYNSDETNLKIALSVCLGVFIGLTPFWGYQIILIVVLAQFLKLNKAIAFIAGNISIPPLIPFILYLSYNIGGIFFAHSTPISFSRDLSLEMVRNNFFQYVIGAFILATITAFVLSVLTYLILLIFRKRKF